MGLLVLLAYGAAVQVAIATQLNEPTTQSLVDIARSRFGTLTPADVLFFTQLEQRAEYADVCEPIDREGTRANLQTDRLIWACTDAEALAHIGPDGVAVRDAVLTDTLNLRSHHLGCYLSFNHCTVKDVVLDGAEFDALQFEYCELESVFLRKAVIHRSFDIKNCSLVHGQVDLSGSSVTGMIDLSYGTVFEGPVNLSHMTLDGMLQIKGSLFCDGLGLQAATLTGDCEISMTTVLDDSVNTKSPIGLQASRMHVDGAFLLEACVLDVAVDVEFASIGLLDDEISAWPSAGRLKMNGFAYEHLAGDSPGSSEQRLSWIRSQSYGPKRFCPQPYEHLASILDNEGYHREATDVLVGMEEDYTRQGQWKWYERWWRYVLEVTIEYGYGVWRCWLAVLVILLARIGCIWKWRIGFVRKQGGVQSSTWPLWLAIEELVPGLDLGVGDRYRPRRAIQWWGKWIATIIGGLAMSLLIAAWAGILKR